jgi:non-specific serine/threonine protein kinase
MEPTWGAVPVSQVREALARLHDLPYLQTHPLARRLPATAPHRPAGELLHRALVDALAALSAPAAAGAASRARIHRLLELAYLEGLPARQVCLRLGLSRSVYYREHARGLAALAEVLALRWASAAEGTGLPGSASPPPVWRGAGALTSFVGRERDTAEVRALLAGARLLTLTGPPGCGKTRLARELLPDLADEYPDGVAFVPLAPLRDPALVLPAVAQALSAAAPRGQQPVGALAAALRHRAALLVLDNFEHLLDAGPAVAELAAACPRLRVLVTSRALLRVYGEQGYPVPPLALPDPDQPPSPERASASPAVRLFVDRARAARPGFALTEENAAEVAAVCRRLDGLPLAIELAAARVRLLSPAALLARLESALGAPSILTGGPRDLPERQRTLHGAIAWSHDLLDADERAVLRRTAVFAGGAGLEAVAAVADPEARRQGAILAAAETLIDKSLLQPAEPAGVEPRVAMLETVREFALGELEAAGERAATERAHAAYFRAFAERHEPDWGPEQPARLERLERDEDNLRAALAWALEHGDADPGLGLGAALRQFWRVRGRWAEGHRWLRRLLALPGATAPTAARAAVLHGAGLLAVHLDGVHPRDAEALLAESLALWRRLGDARQAAWVTRNLGLVAQFAGDGARLRARCEESLAAFRALGDRAGASSSLHGLARAAYTAGERTRAVALAEESLALARDAGSAFDAAQALRALGSFAADRGDLAGARARLDEALAAARTARDAPMASGILVQLGQVARAGGHAAAAALAAQGLAAVRGLPTGIGRAWGPLEPAEAALEAGDHARAAALFREALAMMRVQPGSEDVPACLAGLAEVALATGAPARAGRLLGAAAAVERATGMLRITFQLPRAESDVGRVRAALGAEAFAAAWAAGGAMSSEQAIAYALSDELHAGEPSARRGRRRGETGRPRGS